MTLLEIRGGGECRHVVVCARTMTDMPERERSFRCRTHPPVTGAGQRFDSCIRI